MIVLLLTLLFFQYFTSPLRGQDGASLGLGGANTALAERTEAIYWNPANLAFGDTRTAPIELKVYSFHGGIDNNALSIDLYNKYNGKHLTGSDKTQILNSIPDGDGVRVWSVADVSALAVSYKNYGFSIEGNGTAEGSIDKDAFNFILFGNSSGDSVYSFNSTGKGFGVVKFKVSSGWTIAQNRKFLLPFGRLINVKQLNIGGSFSIIRGVGYVDLIDSHGRLEITNNGLNAPSNFRAREAQGGWGFGVDFGVSMITDTKWSIGFAMDNVINRIRWSKDAKIRIRQFDLRQLQFLDELSDLDLSDYRTSEDRDLDHFSESLPRNYRLGAAKQVYNLVLNGEVSRHNGRMRYMAGMGIFIRFLQLFGGIGYKGEDLYYSGAVGFSFSRFTVDFGIRNRNGITGDSSKGLTVANSLRVRF